MSDDELEQAVRGLRAEGYAPKEIARSLDGLPITEPGASRHPTSRRMVA